MPLNELCRSMGDLDSYPHLRKRGDETIVPATDGIIQKQLRKSYVLIAD